MCFVVVVVVVVGPTVSCQPTQQQSRPRQAVQTRIAHTQSTTPSGHSRLRTEGGPKEEGLNRTNKQESQRWHQAPRAYHGIACLFAQIYIPLRLERISSLNFARTGKVGRTTQMKVRIMSRPRAVPYRRDRQHRHISILLRLPLFFPLFHALTGPPA